jgi:hypothetical protein
MVRAGHVASRQPRVNDDSASGGSYFVKDFGHGESSVGWLTHLTAASVTAVQNTLGDQDSLGRGSVRRSQPIRVAIASSVEPPHISSCGRRLVHTAGRSGMPNSRHRTSSSRCGQRTPEGFPWGSASHGEIEGAMQQAPQVGRHSIT